MLLFRAFAAASLALVPPTDDLVFIDHPSVRQVTCEEGRGSAFQTTAGWISVAHVTALHNCFIDGFAIHVTEQDGAHDFARLDVFSIRNVPMKINCDGYVPGRTYWASGYAFGKPFQTRIHMTASTMKMPDGKRVLVGEYSVIPGMSGGVLYGEDGAAVGLVNAFIPQSGISLSRELKDTSVCSKS